MSGAPPQMAASSMDAFMASKWSGVSSHDAGAIPGGLLTQAVHICAHFDDEVTQWSL